MAIELKKRLESLRDDLAVEIAETGPSSPSTLRAAARTSLPRSTRPTSPPISSCGKVCSRAKGSSKRMPSRSKTPCAGWQGNVRDLRGLRSSHREGTPRGASAGLPVRGLPASRGAPPLEGLTPSNQESGALSRAGLRLPTARTQAGMASCSAWITKNSRPALTNASAPMTHDIQAIVVVPV